jgi:hypothetical protein
MTLRLVLKRREGTLEEGKQPSRKAILFIVT